MTSAEYLERYHRQMAVGLGYDNTEEWRAMQAWAAELRQAYLLMRGVEDLAKTEEMTTPEQECADCANRGEPTSSYLELVARDHVEMQADMMEPGDVYLDSNGDICIWAPGDDEKHGGYTQCCWFDRRTDRAVSTDQTHEEITVIGRLKAVYPDKGG